MDKDLINYRAQTTLWWLIHLCVQLPKWHQELRSQAPLPQDRTQDKDNLIEKKNVGRWDFFF